MAEKEVFRRMFVRVEVHDNRVETVTGMWPFTKKKTIPFRSLSSVDVSRLTNKLILQTNDGDNYAYRLGWLTSRKANAAKEAIARRM